MRKLIPRLSKLLLVTWEISSRTGIWTRQVCQLPEHRRLTIDYLSDPSPQPQLICKLHGGQKIDTPWHLKEALKCLLNKWHKEGGLKLMLIAKHFQLSSCFYELSEFHFVSFLSYILLASAEEWDFNEQKMCWRVKIPKEVSLWLPSKGQRLLYLLPGLLKAGARPRSGVTLSPPQAVSWSQKSPEQRWTPAAVFTDRPTLQGTHWPCRCAQQPACWWLKSNFPSRERPL